MDKEAESEFKACLLYIVPSEANSQQAIELVQQNHELQTEIWVQDVRLLQPPLPPWLNGVPIIVKRATGEVFKGTACLEYLRELSATTLTFLGSTSGSMQSFDEATSVGHPFEAAGIGSGERLTGTDKVTETSLTAYQAAREEQDRHFSGGSRAQELVSTQS